RTAFHEVAPAARLDGIDSHDTVRSLVDGAVRRSAHTGSILTVIAGLGHIGHIHHRAIAASSTLDADPVGSRLRHWGAVAGVVIANVLIAGRQHTVLTVGALID